MDSPSEEATNPQPQTADIYEDTDSAGEETSLPQTTKFINENENLQREEAKKEEREKKGGRRKINIEFIENKSRRHVTFSKRKAGLIKKAYELSTLTGTQVLLLVASETGNVYTFATPKLQPLITKPEGKTLIQACLNPPEVGEVSSQPQQVPTPNHQRVAPEMPSYPDKKSQQPYDRYKDTGKLSSSIGDMGGYQSGYPSSTPPSLSITPGTMPMYSYPISMGGYMPNVPRGSPYGNLYGHPGYQPSQQQHNLGQFAPYATMYGTQYPGQDPSSNSKELN